MKTVEFNFPTNKENPVELLLFCNLSDRVKAYVTERISSRLIEKLTNGMLHPADVDSEVHRLFPIYAKERGVKHPRLDDYMLYVRGDLIQKNVQQ